MIVKYMTITLFVYFVDGYIVNPGPLVIATKGAVWPLPQSIEVENSFYTIHANDFQFKFIGDACPIIHRALRRMWNRQTFVETFGTEESALRWCQENGFLPRSMMCPRHRKPMSYTSSRSGLGTFRCNKGGHGLSVPIARGTWFSGSKLPLTKIFSMMYSFCEDHSHEECRRDAKLQGELTSLSSETICDWYNYCREIVIDDFLINQGNRGKIGGPGKIVQIDESKFGKRKYQRGRQVEGHWVLGMIEDGSKDFRLVVCPGNVRDAETLIPIIKDHVEAGTEIRTDMWRAYTRLPEHGFLHNVVNHSDPEHRFVSESGVHTQRIESCWRPAKDWFRTRRVPHEKFVEVLVEYQWRRECRKNGVEKFSSLINAIRLGYPVWLVKAQLR